MHLVNQHQLLSIFPKNGYNYMTFYQTIDNIWKVFSSLSNVYYISASIKDVKEIPSQAFVPINGVQSQLNEFYLSAQTLGSYLTIKKMAFYNLDNLDSIGFELFTVYSIESWAFALQKKSSKRLNITFSNVIYNNAFNSDSFAGIQRPLLINFQASNIKHLTESAFKSVLDNPLNKISIHHHSSEFSC